MHRLWMLRPAALAAGISFFSVVQAAQPALPLGLQEQVRTILQTGGTTGAAVLLVDALGVSAAYLQGDLRTNSCAPAGAAGDALVALAAMRMAEHGKVDLYAALPASWSKPLGGTVPAACSSRGKAKSTVTLSHLLEHTSGLGEASSQSHVCVANRTAYSASGVRLAALTLEKTTKVSMTALIKREVFAPLAMHSSDWLGDTPAASAVKVTASAASTASANASCAGDSKSAASGLLTTPHDMANMVQMLVQRGQMNEKSYLPPCAVERMGISVSAIGLPGGNTVAAIDRAEYGLGLQRFKVNGQSWLGYSGDSPDARWVWAYSSQSQIGMVILVSGQDTKTLTALKAAVASYLQKDTTKMALSAVVP